MAGNKSEENDETPPNPFASLERADAKKKRTSGRIRGRMKKIGAPIKEEKPKPPKKKKGKHRNDNA